ncbi:Solute carrier organic anion transporter family member 5A1 [Armadillidium vulgare]|nr:Solute carrier organic anion transporter family member 5A1 [Armadillidium vulgare]
MLIADGIPVSYVEEEPETDVKEGEASNIGVILPPPRRSLTDDSLNIPSTSEPEIPITNVDDIVEVVGLSQPISTPLFFHYLPSQSSSAVDTIGQTPPTPKRRGSAINPSMLQFTPQQASSPIKKRVRFNLPGRKISLVGEYEILPPHLSTYHQRRKRHRSGGGGAGGRARKIGTSENDAPRELNGAAHPKRDPPLARSELYLLIFCLVALAQGMIYSYTISIVSTIQKRFNLSSTQAGVILIGNDMSQITITVFIAFYGTYSNRPLWMGVASILSAVSTFMAALPHFIYGPGEIAENIAEDFENATIPDHWKPKVFTTVLFLG